MIEKAYSEKKSGWRNITTSQVARFVLEFKEGDYVLTYDPKTRNYLIGKISSPYRYDPTRKEYHHVRGATWEGEIPRDRLSISNRNTLGAISTLFEVNEEAAKDLLNSFKKPRRRVVVKVNKKKNNKKRRSRRSNWIRARSSLKTKFQLWIGRNCRNW
jgi:predicted Mrr-cat superfamily restriction endonuclease